MSDEATERFLEDLRVRGHLSDEEAELVAPESSGLEMLGRIGRGTQAAVYRCRQVAMDRVVAVKILHPRAAARAEDRERFLREARAAAVLTHPNIVTIHEILPLAGTVAIVMEYVDGGTLAEVLKVRRRFPPAEAVAIVRQVAEALRVAHGRGIIHRDVNPRNIMLTRDGRVKLADMGLARALAESDGVEGKTFGTPYYISPEQVTGDPPPDHRTDLYSLGVTLYEMVAGRPPFLADTPQAVMRMHVLQAPPDPRAFVPDLPQALCGLLAKAMAREPEARYPSAEAFIEALDRLALAAEAAETARLADEPRPGGTRRERRRGGRVAVAVSGKAGWSKRSGAARSESARPGAAGPAGVKRKPLSVLVAGMLAVLALGALGLLGLYAAGVFDADSSALEVRASGGVTIHGNHARHESAPDGDIIGRWNGTDTSVSWVVEVPRPGAYRVAVTYAAGPACKGNRFRVSVGEASLEAPVESTGDWGRFLTRRLGTLEVREAGHRRLTVEPLGRVRGPGLMNLRAVRLTEVE